MATIFVALIINCSLGLWFALSARERIVADGPWGNPAFPLVALFAALLIAPASAYLYLAHPAWSWMYALDPASVPRLAALPVTVAQFVAVVGSYYLGARLLRRGQTKALLYISLASGGILLLAGMLLRSRLFSYGAYQDYAAGQAQDLMEVKLGYVLVALTLGLSFGAGYVILELLRDSRRVRTR